MIKTIIIDEDKTSRLGIKSLLTDDSIEIVGEAADGSSGIKLAFAEKPDVIILEFYLPDMLGSQVCRVINRKIPSAKILFLTNCSHLYTLTSLLGTPAQGLMQKDTDAFSMISAIKMLYEGRSYIQPDMALQLIKYLIEKPAEGVHSLSEKEYQITLMVAQKKTHEKIAENLFISPKTVSNLKSSAMRKLAVKTVDQLQDKLLKDGILPNYCLS